MATSTRFLQKKSDRNLSKISGTPRPPERVWPATAPSQPLHTRLSALHVASSQSCRHRAHRHRSALGGPLTRLGLGRLPGDIVIERESFTLYLPVTSAILVSVVLSVVVTLIRGFLGR